LLEGEVFRFFFLLLVFEFSEDAQIEMLALALTNSLSGS
jgi:hypothetical protein